MKKATLTTVLFREIVLRMQKEVINAVDRSSNFCGEEEFRDLVIIAMSYCGQDLVQLSSELNVHLATISRWRNEHLPPVGHRHGIAVKIADVIRKHNV